MGAILNLNQIVSPYTAAVSPRQPATVYLSTGQSATAPDGGRTPLYADPFPATIAIQPVSTGDLRKLEGLNIQGVTEKLYLNGQLRGLQRINNLGGDLVVLRDGTTYLVKAVLEAWRFVSAGDGWCCVAVILQADAKVSFQDEPRF
jgi:hypothetical protein